MYIPKKLKLNKFRVVQIPSAKDIYARFGACVGSNYSGDSVAPTTMTKMDAASVVDSMDRSNLAKEESAPEV